MHHGSLCRNVCHLFWISFVYMIYYPCGWKKLASPGGPPTLPPSLTYVPSIHTITSTLTSPLLRGLVVGRTTAEGGGKHVVHPPSFGGLLVGEHQDEDQIVRTEASWRRCVPSFEPTFIRPSSFQPSPSNLPRLPILLQNSSRLQREDFGKNS